jgi:hypothetical protein
MNLAVDVRFPETARDQLRVLRAEIQDQDPAMLKSGIRDDFRVSIVQHGSERRESRL